MKLHVAGIEKYIRLQCMSLQLHGFMYKHYIVSVKFIPYLTEKCSCMTTVHRQHKYPCIRILLEKMIIVTVIIFELQMYTAKAEILGHLNGTPTCVVMYGMTQ